MAQIGILGCHRKIATGHARRSGKPQSKNRADAPDISRRSVQTETPAGKKPSDIRLISAKSGPKLKSSEASQLSERRLKDGFELRHASMADLVRYLYNPFASRQAADRPVVDMTSLKGFYDLTLEWTPETAQPAASDAGDCRPRLSTERSKI